MDEEQGLASPIAGGLRGIRRSVSSSIFTGRAAPQQVQGDTISQNLISKNSLTLETVSGQLSGITQQVSSINNSLEAIKNNLQVSDTLERQRQAALERRQAILAEQGLREGKESDLEKRIQFALLTPVRRVKQVAQGILSRLTDAFLFLAGGWLVNTTLTFLRLNAEGNEEELKKFKDKLVGSLIIMGGITLAATIAFGKLLALTNRFTRTLLLVVSTNFIKRPFELLFNFIGVNLNKFKNMLRLGIVGLVNNVKNVDPKAAAQATRDSKILSRSAAATGGVVATQAFFPNKIRQFNNIFRNMFGKPIVTKEMAAATASKATKVGAFSRLGQFGGKLINTFTKLLYVVEGVFDFADYKKRGNNNFQAFMGSATRGGTKYLTFGAGMKGGAFIGGLLGGPPGALIGAILGGIGVGMFGLDEGAADMVGGTVDKMTGADQNVEGDTSMNNNSASENIEGTNQTSDDDISVRPVSFDTSSGIVPF